jgi:hypothetical protein
MKNTLHTFSLAIALIVSSGISASAIAAAERLGESDKHQLEEAIFDAIPQYPIGDLDPNDPDPEFNEGLPISFFPEDIIREDIHAAIDIWREILHSDGKDASDPTLYSDIDFEWMSYPTSLYGEGFDTLVVTNTNHLFCGSGGCSTYFFTKDQDRWKSLGWIFGCDFSNDVWPAFLRLPTTIDRHIDKLCATNRGDEYEASLRGDRLAGRTILGGLLALVVISVIFLIRRTKQKD